MALASPGMPSVSNVGVGGLSPGLGLGVSGTTAIRTDPGSLSELLPIPPSTTDVPVGEKWTYDWLPESEKSESGVMQG